MEKFKLSVVVIAGLLSTSMALAESSLSEFYTSMHPKANETTLKATLQPKTNEALKPTKMHSPVNVTVVNASTSYFYVRVYGAPVRDFLKPFINDHVYNDDINMMTVPLFLEDPRGRVFYNQTHEYDKDVCRLAIVTVFGSPGNYRINVDSDLCY